MIVPDMPGHGFSKGNPCESIQDNANWVYELLVELKVKDLVVVGHSQGCLVSLELNRLYPEILKGIVFVAGSNEIPVNQFLLDLAKEDPKKASRMMVCLLYTSPSPRDKRQSRMPSSA